MSEDVEIPWRSDSSLREDGILDEAHIRTYLDESIEHWRSSDEPYAEYYVDAFQSVRTSLLGETLPLENDI